jgi:hypothetical protein
MTLAAHVLEIKIKIIHVSSQTASALINFTLIFHNRLTVNVSYPEIYIINIKIACPPECAACLNDTYCTSCIGD